jgi:acyl-CoA synthetase (NDP forming)
MALTQALDMAETPARVGSSFLEPLLRPRSIAIVGASPRQDSFAYKLRCAIIDSGYTGQVHLVNPKYQEIEGQRAFKSLAEIPDAIDCAAFAIPDSALEASFLSIESANVSSAVIYGRGQHPASPALHQTIAAIARRKNIAVCGGNCMGYINTIDRIQLTNLPFAQIRPTGDVSLISHSGSSWSGLFANNRGINFNFAISAGQELVTTVAEYIDYLCRQPTTRVIACVLETVRHPVEFLAAAEEAMHRGIPIVALKLGRSVAGRKFAQSHSGAMSGSAAVYEAVFERHGVVSVRSLDELLDTVELFRSPRKPSTRHVGIVTDSGGERQLICDLAADAQLELHEFSSKTAECIRPWLDDDMAVDNPLDYWGNRGSECLRPAFQAVADAEEVGVAVLATNMPDGRPFLLECSAALRSVHGSTSKPTVLLANIAATVSSTEATALRAEGISVLMGTETGLRALKHFTRYYGERKHTKNRPVRGSASPMVWSSRLALERHSTLDGETGFRLLHDYEIPVAPWTVVTNAKDALDFALAVGYPIVAKIENASLLHKSDVGGVLLSLDDPEKIVAGVQKLQGLGFGDKVLVQKQVSGTELIIGMTKDSQFGPVFTIGGGGIFVEVFHDHAVCLPGDDPDVLRRTLHSLRVSRLLDGARGRKRADLDKLIGVIQKFMTMCCELSHDVDEIEINPLIVNGAEIHAADVLVVLNREEHDK